MFFLRKPRLINALCLQTVYQSPNHRHVKSLKEVAISFHYYNFAWLFGKPDC